MTNFANIAFDRDNVLEEVVDRAVVVDDDVSDDRTEADDKLEGYNDESITDNDSDDNNTITDFDMVQSGDEEE